MDWQQLIALGIVAAGVALYALSQVRARGRVGCAGGCGCGGGWKPKLADPKSKAKVSAEQGHSSTSGS